MAISSKSNIDHFVKKNKSRFMILVPGLIKAKIENKNLKEGINTVLTDNIRNKKNS